MYQPKEKRLLRSNQKHHKTKSKITKMLSAKGLTMKLLKLLFIPLQVVFLGRSWADKQTGEPENYETQKMIMKYNYYK